MCDGAIKAFSRGLTWRFRWFPPEVLCNQKETFFEPTQFSQNLISSPEKGHSSSTFDHNIVIEFEFEKELLKVNTLKKVCSTRQQRKMWLKEIGRTEKSEMCIKEIIKTHIELKVGYLEFDWWCVTLRFVCL